VNCFIQYLGSADIVETCPPKGRSVVSNDNFKDLCLLSPPHSKLGIMKSHSVFEFWYMYDNLRACLNMYGESYYEQSYVLFKCIKYHAIQVFSLANWKLANLQALCMDVNLIDDELLGIMTLRDSHQPKGI